MAQLVLQALHVVDYFFFFEEYRIRFRILKIILKEKKTNNGELQHMRYICDEIIFIMEYKKLQTYFKTRIVDGIFW
jgi:hypothetical protein